MSWYANVLGTDAGPSSFGCITAMAMGALRLAMPLGSCKWNKEFRRVLLQGLYENSRSAGLVELEEFGAASDGLHCRAAAGPSTGRPK